MRTNIVLDDELLDKAMALSVHKTKKAVIHEALEAFIKRQEIKQLIEFKGSNLWNEDLEQMRESHTNETY